MYERRNDEPRSGATLLLVLFAAIGLLLVPGASHADNAAFALAPRDAVVAIDARGAAEVLGVGGAAMRPVLESLAGEQALATFDSLARRSNTPADVAAREVFAGRVAFYLTEQQAGGYQWMFGVQADDARCERVLKMLGGRMTAPQRFASATERLVFRRIGGWLLMTPEAGGEARLDAAAARVMAEDAGSSLLGEPLIQEFLASESPVRIFMRHNPPIGGATLLGITRAGNALRADLRGTYEESPIGSGSRPRPLDTRAVRALENAAAMVVSNPSDGVATPSDAFWLALVPELKLSPAMRANLAGERIVAFGTSPDPTRPAMALAWRVEDARQAEADQDAYMHGVCCGLLRAAEFPGARGAEFAPVTAHADRLKAVARQMSDPSAAGKRECDAFGPFVDRYLGSAFKLGGCGLHWTTVETPCGGWQVYASDRDWLMSVSNELKSNSCGEGEHPAATGIGFCDGPRAAGIVRQWRPLVVEGVQGSDRISRGLDALATAVEGLGRVRFRYQTPAPHRVEAQIEIEPKVVAADGAVPAKAGKQP
ncbi:MAG: hypothetical protein RLY21_2359 [Planctomycetota bacterium]